MMLSDMGSLSPCCPCRLRWAAWLAQPVRTMPTTSLKPRRCCRSPCPSPRFLSTYLYEDPEGQVQFSKAFLTSWTKVYGTKVRPGDIDPQEEGNLSFPSGHTMGAFAGASFLQTHYSWVYGLPACFFCRVDRPESSIPSPSVWRFIWRPSRSGCSARIPAHKKRNDHEELTDIF